MRETYAVYEAEAKLPCKRIVAGELGEYECHKLTTGRVVEHGVHLPICALHMPNVEAQKVLTGDDLLLIQKQIQMEELSLPSFTQTDPT